MPIGLKPTWLTGGASLSLVVAETGEWGFGDLDAF